MRTEQTFSILFWVYEKRAKASMAPLYARISVNGARLGISLKYKVDLKYWDPNKQKVLGTNSQSKHTNQFIERVRSRLFEIYQDLKFKNELITPKLIKAIFNGEHQNQKSLQDLMKYHKCKIEGTLSKGTIRNFGVTESYINKFLKIERNTTNVYLKQLDYKFLCDFENFLHNYYPKGHFKAMSQNTVMKHIQRFRKIINLGYNLEWLEKDPFRRWKPSFEKREREFLNENELEKIRDKKFHSDRLDRVRDLFVFSCYTGMSYCDIMNLKPIHLHFGIDGKKWIITKRQKTKTPIKIPLLETAHEILIKYEGNPVTENEGNLLPKITNEKLNVYLKEVAALCEISKNLTFHMARHTFATTITLANGVPIETVSKLLGHTKISTTQIYARILDQKISEDVGALQQKLYAKKNR